MKWICTALFLAFATQVLAYDDQFMDDWHRQSEMNQMRLDQQRQMEEQRRQVEDMRREQQRMDMQLQRERMLRSGQGRSHSPADELYR